MYDAFDGGPLVTLVVGAFGRTLYVSHGASPRSGLAVHPPLPAVWGDAVENVNGHLDRSTERSWPESAGCGLRGGQGNESWVISGGAGCSWHTD